MLTGNVVNQVVINITFSSCFSVTSITVFCFRCLLTSINRLCVALRSNAQKISSHKVLLMSGPYHLTLNKELSCELYLGSISAVS